MTYPTLNPQSRADSIMGTQVLQTTYPAEEQQKRLIRAAITHVNSVIKTCQQCKQRLHAYWTLQSC